MNASRAIKSLLAGATFAASVGVALAQSTPVQPNAASAVQGAGQESTQHTPMGETGTPHGHPGSASQGNSRSSDRAMGAPGSRVDPALGAGQESTQHTPMGETGTPHNHPNAASQGGGRSSDRVLGGPGSRVAPPLGAGQESTQHTPMGETGTPHGHSK
mgnify:CR=1 FL=1